MRREQVIWAAGLYEGEGTIVFTRRTQLGSRGNVNIRLVTTDEDVIRRFHSAISTGTVHGPYDHGGTKPHWQWQANGFERTQYVVAMLWQWLGARRRQQAASAMVRARVLDIPNRSKTHCPQGHPYAGENLYLYNGHHRMCMICRRARSLARSR